MSYHEEKRYDEARIALMEAFRIDSLDFETVFFLGNACRSSKLEEEAVGFYEKSIELQMPDSGNVKDVYNQMAELFKVLHRFDEAFEAYDKVMEYDPADITVYYKIAQTYDRNLNQKKIAIEYYEKFLALQKTDQGILKEVKVPPRALVLHARERINRLKEELFFEE